MTRNPSRRSVLVGTGIAAAGVLGVGSQVSADEHDVPVVIESVTPEEDLIVLRNEGETDVDVSGYVVDWLYNNSEYDQSDELPADTVIEAGDELRITSGYYDTEADVDFGYEAGRIDNEETNVIALYNSSRDEAVSVYDTATGETDPGDPVDDDNGDSDDEHDDNGDSDDEHDDNGDSDDEHDDNGDSDDDNGDEADTGDDGDSDDEEPDDSDSDSDDEEPDGGDSDDEDDC